MDWSLKIYRGENGYKATWSDDGSRRQLSFRVYEDDEKEWGHVMCFQRLLYFITEYFGMTGSKHDKRRIRITTGGEDD